MPAGTRFRARRDTASNWTTANPTLLMGELGFETDTLRFKLGDGSTAWNSLEYVNGNTIKQLATGSVARVFKRIASATANLTEWRTESDALKLYVDKDMKLWGVAPNGSLVSLSAVNFGSDAAFQVERFVVSGGRFDFIPAGSAEMRVTGSSSAMLRFFNVDGGYSYVDFTQATMDIPGTLTFGDDTIQKSAMQTKWLTADVVNNNATANTLADITGLAIPVVSGVATYFKFYCAYTSAATSTGSRWTINGPATSLLVYSVENTLTGSSRSVTYSNTSYNLPAGTNASSANTAGNSAVIEGVVIPSANGTLTPRFSSGVASSAITAKVGSHVLYHRN